MLIQSSVNLKNYNTFKIDVNTRYFVEFCSLDELREALTFINQHTYPFLILGGGSNILFTSDFDGVVLKNTLKGKKILQEDEEHIWIKVQSGENWHKLVEYCVNNHWSGIENLALIPGTVGAAPIQNIGAYGTEIQEVLESLEALHIPTLHIHTFLNPDCQFEYRNSIFKKQYLNQYIILSVTLKLRKKPKLNYSYADVQQFLEQNQLEPSLVNIYHAVIAIRKEKLPDPAMVGNAGSFFKNPYVTLDHANTLKKLYPNMPQYPLNEDTVKIPAAWLIEQCGWKGYRNQDFGVHPKQPLVLVNYANASGMQIYELAQNIMISVKNKFNIQLEPEVHIKP